MASNAMNALVAAVRPVIRTLELLSPLADLGIRFWMARVFWQSGQTKIADWKVTETTLDLFRYEYAVPLLSPEVAAYLATTAENVVPVFLLVGLGSRISALILFIVNWVAAISYPDISAFGMQLHYLWGLVLLVTILHGPGKLSVDHLLRRLVDDMSAGSVVSRGPDPADR